MTASKPQLFQNAGAYGRSAVWTLLGNGGVVVLSFLGTSLVARYLGVESFGRLSYVVSYVLMFTFLSEAGVGAVLHREVSRTPERTLDLLGGAFLLRLIFGTLAYAVMAVVARLFEPDPEIIGQMLMFGFVFFTSMFLLWEWVYDGQVKGKWTASAKLTGAAASFVGRCLVVLLGLGVSGILFVRILDPLIVGGALLIATRLVQQGVPKVPLRVDVAKELFRDSYVLMLSAAAIVVYQKIDIIMLKVLLDEMAVGTYAASLPFFTVVGLLPMSLTRALSPGLYRSKNLPAAQASYRAQLLMDASIWGTIVFAFLLMLMAPFILRVFFGMAYDASVSLAQVTVWRGVFLAFGLASGQWIVSENLQRYSPIRTVAGCVTNLVLNLWWIPRFGAMGAAWGTLVSYAVATWICNFFIPKLRPAFVMQNRALISGIPRLLRFGWQYRSSGR